MFPAGPPVSDYESAPGNTTSTTYVTLTSPSVEVEIGSSGIVEVAHAVKMSGDSSGCWASWEMSGANTGAASDQYAISTAGTTAENYFGRTSKIYNLTPGATTFTLQFKTGGAGTATFENATIDVTPL